MSFYFLSVEEVLQMHAFMLKAHGGADGVRDWNGLSAAVHAPRNVWAYEDGDVFDVAAAYAFHIAQSQAFVDGNKRAGLAACLGFLDANGVSFEVEGVAEDVFHKPVRGFADRSSNRGDFAVLLRKMFGDRKDIEDLFESLKRSIDDD